MARSVFHTVTSSPSLKYLQNSLRWTSLEPAPPVTTSQRGEKSHKQTSWSPCLETCNVLSLEIKCKHREHTNCTWLLAPGISLTAGLGSLLFLFRVGKSRMASEQPSWTWGKLGEIISVKNTNQETLRREHGLNCREGRKERSCFLQSATNSPEHMQHCLGWVVTLPAPREPSLNPHPDPHPLTAA